MPATVAQRTVLLLIVGIAVSAFIPLATSQSPPADDASTSQPSATTQPATSQPSSNPPRPRQKAETVSDVLRRLHAKSAKESKPEEIALRAGLEFCRAVGEARGPRAGALIDAVGYQALPLTGDLPDEPLARTLPRAIALDINSRSKIPVGNLPADLFRLITREQVGEWFPAAQQWMLDSDFALVIEQPPSQLENWVTQPCCIIIRLRNREPSIVAGSLLQAIVPSERTRAPRG